MIVLVLETARSCSSLSLSDWWREVTSALREDTSFSSMSCTLVLVWEWESPLLLDLDDLLLPLSAKMFREDDFLALFGLAAWKKEVI